MGEIVVILVLAFIFIGPDKLPGVARKVGQGIRSLKRHSRDLQDTLDKDDTIGPSLREIKGALNRGVADFLAESPDPPDRREKPKTRDAPKVDRAAGAPATGSAAAPPASLPPTPSPPPGSVAATTTVPPKKADS